MARYTISRALISIGLAVLLGLTGAEWWMAALIGALTFGFFLWAPRSGRYAVHPEKGVTALRRDERIQSINDRAGRNGFVGMALALGALAIYFGSIAPGDVPVGLLSLVMVLGILVYFVTDFWLRRP